MVDADQLAQHHVKSAQPGARNARCLVACGEKQVDEQILIVDPVSLRRLPPDEIGEIRVRGPHIAKGYWNRPDETERTFRARLSDEGPFLRTGDLGFLREDQLYVTGRIKDLIIVRGRNHYPHDVELTAERSHPALRPGCGAAFSRRLDQSDELVLLQELRRADDLDFDKITAAIRGAIAATHGITPQVIALVPAGAILKTSSGKICAALAEMPFKTVVFR